MHCSIQGKMVITLPMNIPWALLLGISYSLECEIVKVCGGHIPAPWNKCDLVSQVLTRVWVERSCALRRCLVKCALKSLICTKSPMLFDFSVSMSKFCTPTNRCTWTSTAQIKIQITFCLVLAQYNPQLNSVFLTFFGCMWQIHYKLYQYIRTFKNSMYWVTRSNFRGSISYLDLRVYALCICQESDFSCSTNTFCARVCCNFVTWW